MLSQLTCKDKTKSKPQDSIPSFIRKTYDILEERKFPDIIDWNPEGTALVIKKPSEFCQKVLPAYFKHNNLTSFVRQLNMYNFHKKRTQNIDHVYSHELFQRGQKHLLKEIKRKGQEHNLDKSSPKSPEHQFIESAQTPKDLPSLCYENQILKRLYNEAMTKINKLESQVTELSSQNQSLWSQICSGNQQNPALMARFEKSELTLDQLPMTFGDISIPPLKLSGEHAPLKKAAPTTINGFFNSAPEDSGESTDASHNSPSLHQPSMESEKCFDMTEATPLTTSTESTYTLPPLSLTPLISQTPQVQPKDLFASRTEMSVGYIFEAWNNEFQQQNNQDTGVLGKRHLDTENVSAVFQVPEPSMKRQESIGLFIKKGLISNGAEDREFFRKMLGKNNSSTNEDCEFGMGIDLMGF